MMHNKQKLVATTLLIGALVVCACSSTSGMPESIASAVPTTSSPATNNASSSGTGSNNTSDSGTARSTTTVANPPPTDIIDTSLYDIGLMGSVGAPAPASFGASPSPAQIATPDGPSFPVLQSITPSGSATITDGPYPSNATFPILFTGLQQDASGLSAIAPAQSGTVTVTVHYDGGYAGGPGPYAEFHLVIPSLNIDTTYTCCDDTGLVFAFWGNYVDLEGWGLGSGGASQGRYVYGYETPPSSVPATGQANFSGGAVASVYTPVNGHILNTGVDGDATLSVDFSSGKIVGAFTNMSYQNIAHGQLIGNLPWNDVSVNASIVAGSSKFSGTTAAASAPQNTFSLTSNAAGTINGGFYGPAAQELGAIWTLSDGTTSAIGGVAAGR